MELLNVFKMEIFKNINDRTNLIIMGILLVLNTVGGISVRNAVMSRHGFGLGETMATVFGFSIFATVVFLFAYPYQLARMDYKNKVMSLMIASGVSRVQYYFVKTGATLLFSLASFILLVLIPFTIVGEVNLADFHFVFNDPMDIVVALSVFSSAFFILMTSVILMKGRASTIFVFIGLNWLSSLILSPIMRTLFDVGWNSPDSAWRAMYLTNHLIIIVIFGLLGVLAIRKQDL